MGTGRNRGATTYLFEKVLRPTGHLSATYIFFGATTYLFEKVLRPMPAMQWIQQI